MNKSTVSVSAINNVVSAEDSLNTSLFTFGAVWALSMGYLPVIGVVMMLLVGAK